MNKLKEIVAYLCMKYPHKNELSKARLTKMVYLADWRSAIIRGKQLTNIEWVFNHYGPYVEDVINTTESYNLFNQKNTFNMFGFEKTVVEINNEHNYKAKLKEEEIEILDHVIENTKDLSWKDFIKLVYSTYPVVNNDRFNKLNLIECAKKYISH